MANSRKQKTKTIAFGNKEHTQSRKSETRFDRVSSYAQEGLDVH